MKKQIKYKILKEGTYTIGQFKSFFIEYMDIEDYLLSSRTLIVSAALSYINFKMKLKDKATIEGYALKVLRCFKTDLRYINLDEKPIDTFFHVILSLQCKPVIYKCEIESQVKYDLWKIETLLERYRQQRFIILFEQEPYTPRSHREKTEIEFFVRAKSKYNEISQYLVKELDLRAINKALGRIPEEMEPWMRDSIIRNDIPYYEHFYKKEFVYEIDYEKIDSQKINLLKNKWSWLGFSVCYKYNNNEYKKIISKVDKSNIIKELNEGINSIPTLKNRKPIFKELNKLFKNKNYYGFYALAIPQIEGLFADMIHLIEPNSKKLSKSLGEKVNYIWSFYESSNFYFDYYMYYLPKQRNKFSHSGKDDNIKGKSYQILLDLLHIISIYSEIDSPFNKLNNTINDGILHLTHIGNYADFLIQISKTKSSKEYHLIEGKVNRFSKKLFKPESRIEAILDLLFEDFNTAFINFDENLQFFSKNKEKVSLLHQDMQSIVDNISFFKKDISDSTSILFNGDFKVLADTITFIKIYPNSFRGLNKTIDNKIKIFVKNQKSKIDKIHFLNSELEIEIPDFYSLNKKYLKHMTIDIA